MVIVQTSNQQKMNKLLILLILTTFSSCGQVQTKVNSCLPGNNVVEFVQHKNDKQFFTDPIDDTINFKKVVDNIFEDREGKIYILNMRFRPISKDTFLYTEFFKEVSDFLDLKSYKQLQQGFFQNKGRVFYWWGNSDGDFPIEVIRADPNTFVPFDSVGGGTDSHYVFYGGGPDDFKIIEGANPKTIQVLNPARGCWNCGTCYFVDDKAVYYGLNQIEGADPESFKLVNKEAIDAADKNGNYFEGHLIK